MAKIAKEKLETDFYHTKAKNRGDIYALRRSLAKSANQRMVRLEQASSKVSGGDYTFGAYEVIAQKYLEDIGKAPLKGQDVRRFSEALGKKRSENEILKEILVLQKFLSAPTSLVSEQRKIEEKRITTFEEKGITFASNKEFYDFINSESFNYLSTHGITSDDIVDYYQKARDEGITHEQLQERLDDYRNNNTGRRSTKGLMRALGISNK